MISQVEEPDPSLVLDYIDRNRDKVELWQRTNPMRNNSSVGRKKTEILPGTIE